MVLSPKIIGDDDRHVTFFSATAAHGNGFTTNVII